MRLAPSYKQQNNRSSQNSVVEKWQKDQKAKRNNFAGPVTGAVMLERNVLLDWDCLIWQRVLNIRGLLPQSQRKSWDRKEW